jgi:hypothetical protein
MGMDLAFHGQDTSYDMAWESGRGRLFLTHARFSIETLALLQFCPIAPLSGTHSRLSMRTNHESETDLV